MAPWHTHRATRAATRTARFIPCALLALLLLPPAASAGEATTLKTIMQGLRDDAAVIADGLFTDDLERVGRGAAAIADHPRIPPEQVRLVADELGPEMPAFKQLDTRVHDLAMRIGEAAAIGEQAAAFGAFKDMMDGCMACHAAFKARVAGVLKSGG